jgi:hypothetical protein
MIHVIPIVVALHNLKSSKFLIEAGIINSLRQGSRLREVKRLVQVHKAW